MGFGGKHVDRPYLEQYARILRWQAVLHQDKVSESGEDQSDYQVDRIFAFFVNCFYLKDWIIDYDEALRPSLNTFFGQYAEMGICRDIGNACKHLSLTDPSTGAKALGFMKGLHLVREYDPSPGPKPVKNQRYSYVGGGEQGDPYDLADRCVERWKEFLNQKKLLPRKQPGTS